MIVARSAGCSSARPAWGTRSLMLAIEVSTGSTSSQSMYRSGVGRRRLRASVRYWPSIPRRRRTPDAPTSTATRRSEFSIVSRRRSLTRTTLRPSMSTICLSMRSSRRRISFGRCLNLSMSIVLVRSWAPERSMDATDDHGRKIRRLSVFTTRPVTGGYRSPTATMRSATLPIGSFCRSRTGRPMAWLR